MSNTTSILFSITLNFPSALGWEGQISQDTIAHLKLLGFKRLQFVLLDPENPYQAKVEIIPQRDESFGLDTVSLWTKEINDFGDWHSPMVKYLIDPIFLNDSVLA